LPTKLHLHGEGFEHVACARQNVKLLSDPCRSRNWLVPVTMGVVAVDLDLTGRQHMEERLCILVEFVIESPNIWRLRPVPFTYQSGKLAFVKPLYVIVGPRLIVLRSETLERQHRLFVTIDRPN